MPGATRRAIRRASARLGFPIVDAPRHAPPNVARNAGLRRAHSEFVAIVDNDVLFGPEWVKRLIACADATGADLVGPLICIGDSPFRRVHSAGGTVAADGGRFVEVQAIAAIVRAWPGCARSTRSRTTTPASAATRDG